MSGTGIPVAGKPYYYSGSGSSQITTNSCIMVGFYCSSGSPAGINLYDTSTSSTSGQLLQLFMGTNGWYPFPAIFQNGIYIASGSAGILVAI